MKKTLIALALGLSWSVAEAQRPMTADDVLALKQVGDAQISPDGKWVAYTVSAVDLAQNATNSDLWLVATAGGFLLVYGAYCLLSASRREIAESSP